LIICFCIFANAIHAAETDLKAPAESEKARKQKMLSLFSIVTFPNQGCASQDSGSRNGTCYTSSECQNKGGSSSGNCAAGFGVCCLFIVSSTSDTISENCSYIQNPSFPSVYSETSSLTYTINKCSSEVCAVRLDFETFTTLGPADTVETNGGACQDSFVVRGTGSGLTTPVICGSNAGQHIYMDMGNGASDTATLTFTFAATTSTIRTWELKATQIPCSSPSRPDLGCLQYHTTLAGRFQTFNYADSTNMQHLASQNYNICIRQEAGYCCNELSPCGDTNAYSLSNSNAMAMQDEMCTADFVEVDGLSHVCGGYGTTLVSRVCGVTLILNTKTTGTIAFSTVYDTVAPFNVQIVTDAAVDAIANGIQRGLCFDYKQIPCSP